MARMTATRDQAMKIGDKLSQILCHISIYTIHIVNMWKSTMQFLNYYVIEFSGCFCAKFWNYFSYSSFSNSRPDSLLSFLLHKISLSCGDLELEARGYCEMQENFLCDFSLLLCNNRRKKFSCSVCCMKWKTFSSEWLHDNKSRLLARVQTPKVHFSLITTTAEKRRIFNFMFSIRKFTSETKKKKCRSCSELWKTIKLILSFSSLRFSCLSSSRETWKIAWLPIFRFSY